MKNFETEKKYLQLYASSCVVVAFWGLNTGQFCPRPHILLKLDKNEKLMQIFILPVYFHNCDLLRDATCKSVL